ncbi:glycoside hydrolase family 3 N-terminal domain-containing protein [Streptomyces pinistramenti]|uniref:glycoside hydrolase family 3 N-terminal domain-containing protein n=1 Tax=Streptomyces pinistramenti TaxID=2884812 RepID=UPI001D06A5E8|nr:glycoside hydrolase family 3 N-terminal domain-containing protein [Streptomyces pinistramenti]MCB5906539.1 glycoside hydrolase family 3 protein [Streptomyces pinistramenti]
MSELDRLVNTCLLPGVTAGTAPDWAHTGLDAGLPGFVLFPGAPDGDAAAGSTDAVLHSARALRATAPDALIGVDEEGGDVTRLESDHGSSYPGNLALGVADDLGTTARVAAALAADLRAAGVNLSLAPSVDVNSDPDNPVIGVRSFGQDPRLVGAHSAAFIGAVQAAGVAACAKHFPGHGATVVDSHHALAVVDCDLATFRSRELPPFVSAIEAGVRSVMAANVLFPALDAEHPANLSRALLHGLLREELGYEGVVIGTAIAIAGPLPAAELGRTAVDSLRAGADLLLLGPGEGERVWHDVRDAVVAAVRAGELDAELLEAAAQRVADLRRWAAPADRSAGLEAARRAVRAEGTVALPGPATVVELVAAGNVVAGDAHWELAGPLAELGLLARTIRTSAAEASAKAILAAADGTPLVLAVRDAHRAEEAAALVAELLAGRPDAVLIAVGMPEDTALTTGASIRTYGAGAVNTRAAAELLAGRGSAQAVRD